MFQPFKTTLPSIPEVIFDVRDYGAVGDGITVNTKAINAAIEAASEKGGMVNIPSGVFLTGPIHLLSNVNLHLSDNALVRFVKNEEEWPLIVTDYEGIRRIRAVSPIHAEYAENFAITGQGTFNANGHEWRPVKQFKQTEKQWAALLKKSPYVIPNKEGGIWFPSKSAYDAQVAGEIMPADIPGDGVAPDEETRAFEEEQLKKATPGYDLYRPVMMSLRHCKQILLEGVTFEDSPAWCLHPYFCEDLTIKGITVFNPYYAQNGDGIDVESCKNVEIADSHFTTGDDGICLKAGKNATARKVANGICENIYIHNCTVGNSHGGFVVGSEMSRGIRNVLVSNCTFTQADVGIRFKSAMGRGGVVSDIYMEDLNMSDISGEAIILTMNYSLDVNGVKMATVESDNPEDIPEFKDLYFKNITCFNAGQKLVIKPMPLSDGTESIHDIHFENCPTITE